jgi:hypothetical protein
LTSNTEILEHIRVNFSKKLIPKAATARVLWILLRSRDTMNVSQVSSNLTQASTQVLSNLTQASTQVSSNLTQASTQVLSNLTQALTNATKCPVDIKGWCGFSQGEQAGIIIGFILLVIVACICYCATHEEKRDIYGGHKF